MIGLQLVLAAGWCLLLALFLAGAMRVQRAYEADVIAGFLERQLQIVLADLVAQYAAIQSEVGRLLLPVLTAAAAVYTEAMRSLGDVMTSSGTSIAEWMEQMQAEDLQS